MFTSNIDPKAKAAAIARLGNGLVARQPSFGSLCSSSDDELEQCESPAVDVWQPDPLLADDLMEDLDAGFWQAQEDLLSQEELLSALGGGLSEGFDPCLAKHAVRVQKRRKATHAPRPSSAPLPPASTSSAAA